MTKQEVKDESKETDGRPEVKARVRQLQREASRRRMLPDAGCGRDHHEPDALLGCPGYKDGTGAPVLSLKARFDCAED